MNKKQKFNPFYGLVVLTGIVFVLTTLTYVVTLVRQQRAADDGEPIVQSGPVLELLDRHGGTILLWQAALLALFALLAMVLDRWRSARSPGVPHLDRDVKS